MNSLRNLMSLLLTNWMICIFRQKRHKALAESKAVEVNAPENWEAYKKATQLADVISKWKNRVTRIDKNEPNLKKKL